MSILPDPFRQGDIHFFFAKKLPYLKRIKLIIAFLIAGLLVQLFLNFWLGLVFLCIATSLGLIKGYTHKPIPVGKEEWNQVTPDEYGKVKIKQEQLMGWDINAFDITNIFGGTVFVILAVFCVGIWIYLNSTGNERLALYWGLDTFVILAPHWITGVRSFLKKDRLIIKIDLLEKIMDMLSTPSDIQVLPMLSTRKVKDGGRMPMDARLMIRLLNGPDHFLGMQVQISINDVQGRDYPYLYCVIIAKQEADLFRKKRNLIGEAPKKIIFEETGSDGVDVLVIRQFTTQRTGYHTSVKQSKHIVETSLDTARRLMKN